MNFKNKTADLLFGLCFMVAGVGLAGNAFGWWNYRLFFDGWWTLIIIIPMLISIFKSGFHAFNTITLFIGIVLFLSEIEVLPEDTIYQLIVPLIFLVIGFQIIFKGVIRRKIPRIKFNNQSNNRKAYTAIFGGQEIKISKEVFQGGDVNAVFGSVELDLRDAIINEDVIINMTVAFGGVEIYLPTNVKVSISSIPIFGAVSNKAQNRGNDSDPMVYVNATCIFGGVDVI